MDTSRITLTTHIFIVFLLIFSLQNIFSSEICTQTKEITTIRLQLNQNPNKKEELFNLVKNTYPLIQCVEDKIRNLVCKHININTQDSLGYTLLHWAAITANEHMYDLLIDLKADKTIQSFDRKIITCNGKKNYPGKLPNDCRVYDNGEIF